MVSVLVSFVLPPTQVERFKKGQFKKTASQRDQRRNKGNEGLSHQMFLLISPRNKPRRNNNWRGVRFKRARLNFPISPNYYISTETKKKLDFPSTHGHNKINSGRRKENNSIQYANTEGTIFSSCRRCNILASILYYCLSLTSSLYPSQ